MSKQTAVEWLIQQMLKQGYFEGDKPFTFTNISELQNKALAMEKEQIVEAYDNGYDLRDDMGSLSSNPKGEQYYNKTYGGQE